MPHYPSCPALSRASAGGVLADGRVEPGHDGQDIVRRLIMDATALREIQAPLKAKYRDDPGAAVVTLKAEGRLDGEGIACRVDTGRALVEAGLHPATGGSGLQACSGD